MRFMMFDILYSSFTQLLACIPRGILPIETRFKRCYETSSFGLTIRYLREGFLETMRFVNCFYHCTSDVCLSRQVYHMSTAYK